jgi:hypothetical protein
LRFELAMAVESVDVSSGRFGHPATVQMWRSII